MKAKRRRTEDEFGSERDCAASQSQELELPGNGDWFSSVAEAGMLLRVVFDTAAVRTDCRVWWQES